MNRKKKIWLLLAGFLAVLCAAYPPLERRGAAVRLLSAMQSEDRKVSPTPGQPLLGLTMKDGTPIAARVYGPPSSEARLSIVLAHGIHHRGITEPRLVRFAQHLARRGCRVITPELRDLADYQVTESGVEVLRRTVDFAARSDEDVGLLGFSFAGGLAMIAAQDTSTSARLRYVASVGGYHDLARALRFLATNRVQTLAGSEERVAHEYGLLVLLYGHLGHFELGSDEEPLRTALGAWLQEDRPEARLQAQKLTSAKGRRLFELLETQKLPTLSSEILPILESRAAALAALSPAGHLGNLHTPLIFLHGSGDNVVPPEETLFAAEELKHAGFGTYHALVTPLLDHVRVAHDAGLREKLALVNLISQLL